MAWLSAVESFSDRKLLETLLNGFLEFSSLQARNLIWVKSVSWWESHLFVINSSQIKWLKSKLKFKVWNEKKHSRAFGVEESKVYLAKFGTKFGMKCSKVIDKLATCVQHCQHTLCGLKSIHLWKGSKRKKEQWNNFIEIWRFFCWKWIIKFSACLSVDKWFVNKIERNLWVSGGEVSFRTISKGSLKNKEIKAKRV